MKLNNKRHDVLIAWGIYMMVYHLFILFIVYQGAHVLFSCNCFNVLLQLLQLSVEHQHYLLLAGDRGGILILYPDIFI